MNEETRNRLYLEAAEKMTRTGDFVIDSIIGIGWGIYASYFASGLIEKPVNLEEAISLGFISAIGATVGGMALGSRICRGITRNIADRIHQERGNSVNYLGGSDLQV